ncbi:MAG: TIGR00282 family metallophosphoesterase [Clostridia bacterium]
MNFLIIGDVVGRTGLNKLKEKLALTIKDENIDICIVNGENSANGKGLRKQEYMEILSYGADVITMGNHVYYRKEMANEYIKLPRLVIPANILNLNGNGYVLIDKNSVKVAVIQLIGSINMGELFENKVASPFKTVLEEIKKVKSLGADYIFVDFHAEVTSEKMAMGYFLSDKVDCMYGTHTHVQTSDEKIVNNKMAYITDVGMTGPKDSVLGLKKEIAIKRFLNNENIKYECCQNESSFCGIIVKSDDEEKRIISIKRINE